MFTNWLTSSVTASASSPDIILEIGPLPFTRFAAHSTLLAAHSGYLRSAIRPGDRTMDSPIYVPNITAEHFAPLLTYMYTGFLDLSIENIFGVLLATHVLHMPRALEICRSFLARIQSDGYFGSGNFMASPTTSHLDKRDVQHATATVDAVKVIRPIASKATVNGLAFVAPPIAKPLLPSHDTPFRSLSVVPHKSIADRNKECLAVDGIADEEEMIAVTEKRIDSPVASTSKEDATDTSAPPKKQYKITSMSAKKSHRIHKRSHRSKMAKSPVIEVALLDSIQNMNDNNPDKVIIDVASCDGPVRFQRVLNVAYCQFPGQTKQFSTASSSSSSSTTSSTTSARNERNRRTVANSFHMQMARNISEHHALGSMAADSENSQEIIVHDKSDEAISDHQPLTQNQNPNHYSSSNSNNTIVHSGKSDELYSCIYCKHTFKSQYCYQKHAKRHINPLSIDGDALTIDAVIDSGSERGGGAGDDGQSKGASSAASAKSAVIRREVRPLDMNVQYYPCKTCGSKFPSYYFVHKHRKMCHANEEN